MKKATLGVGPRCFLSAGRLWGLTGVVFVILGIYKSIQHLTFNTQAYDLGIRANVLYNIAFHGKVWDSLYSLHGFSGHFHPVSFVLAGLYRIWPDPLLLCLLQAAAVSVGLFLFISLIDRLVEDGKKHLPFIALFLINPFMHNVLCYDFHPEIFAIPLVFAFFLLFEKDKVWWSLLPALSLLLLKEDMGLVLFALGIYALLKRKWILGSVMAFIGFVWLPLVLLLVIPHFHSPAQGELISLHYQALGSNAGEIMRTLLQKPWIILTQVFARPQTLLTVALLAASVGAFALTRWEAALALPLLLAQLLSDYPHQMELSWQYSAGILPILFFASIRGVKKIGPWLLWLFLLLALPPVILRFPNPFPQGINSKRVRETYQLIARIPRDASVSANNNLAPYLVNRQEVFLYPRISNADYMLVDLEGNIYPASWESRYERFRVLTMGYETLKAQDGLFLMKRKELRQ